MEDKMGFFKKEQEVQANTLCLEEPTMVEKYGK
jgi:hypothetical protein